MCKKGNQTIYQVCADKLRKMGYITNKDRRNMLSTHGGCMTAKLDTEKVLALK